MELCKIVLVGISLLIFLHALTPFQSGIGLGLMLISIME